MVDRKTFQEAITICAEIDNTIYFYFKGMEYSCELEKGSSFNYQDISRFRDKLLSNGNSITLEEFIVSCQMRKGMVPYIIAFPLSRLTLIDVLRFCSQKLSSTSFYIHTDMEYIMLDDDKLEMDHSICMLHSMDYAIVEIGDGVIEIAAIGNDTKSLNDNLRKHEITSSIIELDDIQYKKSLIHGMLIQFLISSGKIKNILPLNLSCINNIDCVIEINGVVRDFKHLYSRNTIPTKQNVELYLDNGKLFLYLDDFHIPIPISERWSYYLPNRINVGIDIDPHNKITITIKDCSNNREIYFDLIDLLSKEKILSFEKNLKIGFSREEQEYIDSVRDYLEESDEIDARGRRLLNRLRERLGISEERAKELETL